MCKYFFTKKHLINQLYKPYKLNKLINPINSNRETLSATARTGCIRVIKIKSLTVESAGKF